MAGGPAIAQGDPLGDVSRSAAVVGASGFLGAWIVKELLAQKVEHIKAIDITRDDHLGVIADGEARGVVEFVKCDVSDEGQALAALAGVDVVFHTVSFFGSPAFASKEYVLPRQRQLMLSVNVDGTRHLLEAATKQGARAFVFTSTAAVACGSNRDMDFVGEDVDVPEEEYSDLYTVVKRRAETLVKGYDGACGGRLRTCSIRPVGIWGPSAKAVAMTAGIELGTWPLGAYLCSGEKKLDWSHVQNVVDAEILAAQKCLQDGDLVGGKAYTITDGRVERDQMYFIGRLCEAAGALHWPVVPLGDWTWWAFCSLVSHTEFACFHATRWLRPAGPAFQPLSTRTQMNKARFSLTFSIERARRDLGYEPADVDALLPETAAFCRERYGEHMRALQRNLLAAASVVFSAGLALSLARWRPRASAGS